MRKNMDFIIAQKLVEWYKILVNLKLQMTDVENAIWQQIETGSDKYLGWNSPRKEFFYKKITHHKKEFYKPTSVSKGHGEREIQKPIFRIGDYGIDDQVMFWKVYIENIYKDGDTKNGNMKRPYRKSSYNFTKKIDIDQKYDLIMQVLKELKPDIEYPNLNYTFEKDWYGIYRFIIRIIAMKIAKEYENHKERIQSSGSILYDHEIIYVFNLQNIWISIKNTRIFDAFHLMNSWINLDKTNISNVYNFKNEWLNLKDTPISNITTNFDSSIVQKIYYVQWDLWIYVIMQNFYYIFKHGLITKGDVLDIINEMHEIGVEIQYQKDLRNSSNIADAYFDYNYLLKIRTCCLEEIHFGSIKPDEYIFVKQEDMFLKESDVWAKYSLQELFEKFHSGVDKVSGKKKICTLKTFGERLDFCKKFAKEYSILAERDWDSNSNKVLRAVYRALYINSCKYNRQNSATMAKKILEGDEKVLSKHYILGMSISRELQLEELNGREFVEETTKFMRELYELALNFIYKFLPSISAPKKCLNEAFGRLDETMKRIVKILYAKIS